MNSLSPEFAAHGDEVREASDANTSEVFFESDDRIRVWLQSVLHCHCRMSHCPAPPVDALPIRSVLRHAQCKLSRSKKNLDDGVVPDASTDCRAVIVRPWFVAVTQDIVQISSVSRVAN